MLSASVSYWLRCASSVRTITSGRSHSVSGVWNFWISVKTYRWLPRSSSRRAAPLLAWHSLLSLSVTAPVALKVFAI